MKNGAKMAVGAVHLYPTLQEQLEDTAVAIGDSQHGGSPANEQTKEQSKSDSRTTNENSPKS